MNAAIGAHSRHLFVPEIIQTSGMDCGPASLKALLEGFGIPTNYNRLRAACQTDVDGTSIDVLEQVAVRLGLDATQLIVPEDHLLMEEADALPALVVTRLPNGLTHFIVLWARHYQFVQVMDPGSGRLWQTKQSFCKNLYIHRFAVSPSLAHQWLTVPAFVMPLRRRLEEIGASPSAIDLLLEQALMSGTWLPVAVADAATRLATHLVRTGALARGQAAVSLVTRLAADSARQDTQTAGSVIPSRYWSAAALPSGEIELRGAVIIHVAGRMEPVAEAQSELRKSPELTAALIEDKPKLIPEIVRATFEEDQGGLLAVPLSLLLAGASAALEVVLLNGLMGTSQTTRPTLASTSPLFLVLSFLCVTLLLEVSVSAVLLRLGRALDVHLRMRLFDKLPRLGNYYFHTRLKSDLAQRAHELRSLRNLPQHVGSGLRAISELVVTVAGIIWISPSSALPAILAALLVLCLPLCLAPLLREQDVRRETHTGALTRFYFDALLGLVPIKAHRGEEPMRIEHESLLCKWAAATRAFYFAHLGALAAGLAVGTIFAIWIMAHPISHGGRREITLLFVYWVLKLPSLAQRLVNELRQAPAFRSRLLRLFEVLSGPEETTAQDSQQDKPILLRQAGVSVLMRGVAVQASGQRILSDVDLDIKPGQHIAVVGPSGSGKTSLVSLLLGWHRAAQGSVLIDGERAEPEMIKRLRRQTAWVDPTVQIWNRSFEQNLRYGNGAVDSDQIRQAVKDADLTEVVSRLPAAMDSSLGEGGGLMSGGEGQRVRFARALLREGVRLVILDEPFRGLDGDKRRELLAVARSRWSAATLIYVSHDIDSTLDFGRVLVMQDGRIVEDGNPLALLEHPDSRFSQLNQAQLALKKEIWRNPIWRRWSMERGELREQEKDRP